MRNDHRKQRLLSMKRSSKFIAAAILAGAVRVSPDDTPERTKRIVIAQLYRRFRMARRHTLRASAWRGPESDFAETCRAAESEAWNRDRKHVVSGKSVTVRVAPGGRRTIKK